VVEVRSVTCNDCLRELSLLGSKLTPRECPGRRIMLKRRANRPSREECFCLFSEGATDVIEDVEADLKML
jgi:hypothetical protein